MNQLTKKYRAANRARTYKMCVEGCFACYNFSNKCSIKGVIDN